MSSNNPKLVALDFDGVICNGLKEYFESTKLTYWDIWKPGGNVNFDDFAPSFYRLRPVIETGWEMPLLLRALVLGIPEKNILQNWHAIVQELVKTEQLDWKNIGKKLDKIRDEWIASDLQGWLDLHSFYPGIIFQLTELLNSDIELYIITTKEGRFVKQLLQMGGLELPNSAIIGKECKRPKYETLRKLIQDKSLSPKDIWFIEDRLEALESVRKQPDLQGIKLYLADWGYNTQQTRDSLKDNQEIQLLSLQDFLKLFMVVG